MTPWAARFAELRALDGDAWDALHAKLQAEWKAEYRAAFLDICWRRGWAYEAAHLWLESGELADEAWYDGRDETPQECAALDVEACEREAADA